MLIQAYPISSLSFDQSKQSDSPNGKITLAVFCFMRQNRHCLDKLCKCRKAISILPHEAKALLQQFCLQPIIFGWRQNSFSGAFASWGIIKIHYFAWADQDWIGFNFIGSGLDSDWKNSQSAHLWYTGLISSVDLLHAPNKRPPHVHRFC